MKFNVNQYVKVRLTDYGRKIHKEDHDKLNSLFGDPNWEYHKVQEDENGWSKWQLWDLMRAFGKHCYNGCKPPFDTNIEIVEE